jgi:hypothetical protein
MHTYIHTYIRTYIHTSTVFVHLLLSVNQSFSLLVKTNKLIQSLSIHTRVLLQLIVHFLYIHTYIHTYIHSFIYTYIHTYTYIYTKTRSYKHINIVQTYKIYHKHTAYIHTFSSGIQKYVHSKTHL